MIASPVGIRLTSSPGRSLRDSLREAAALGAKGVILDAVGDLNPERLGETGRRELRHLLRSAELTLIALGLPTRRPFDTLEQLDDRLARADRAFALAYELGARLVVARVGAIPDEDAPERRSVFTTALGDLARRADHRGARFAMETGPDPGDQVAGFLAVLASPTLAASIDPAALLSHGHDPVAAVRSLAEHVAHAYANDSAGRAAVANPRGFGFAPGALDWEEYLGALEEIGYRGFLTVWPDPERDVPTQFRVIAERLRPF